MPTINREYVEKLLAAFMAKDIEGVMAYFADDALFFDPHYPTPQMRGKAAIREGIGFALGMLKEPGFKVRYVWGEGASGAAEVDTHHVFGDGSDASFPQVFILETRDGLLTRLQAYVPYPPPGQPAA